LPSRIPYREKINAYNFGSQTAPVLPGSHSNNLRLHGDTLNSRSATSDFGYLAVAIPSLFDGDIFKLTRSCIRYGIAEDYALLSPVQLSRSEVARPMVAWLLVYTEASWKSGVT
jgi:hypothetical protein